METHDSSEVVCNPAPLIDAPPTWRSVEDLLQSVRFRENVLPAFLQRCRWFGGKAHTLRSVEVVDAVPLGCAATGGDAGRLALVRVDYSDSEPETYIMPLQLADAAPASQTIVARLSSPEGGGVLFDAMDDGHFRSALLEIIVGEKRLTTGAGDIVGVCSDALRAQRISLPLSSRALKAEQSNSAVIYDGRFFLKLYRKPESGLNPEAELLRFLSERGKFQNVPAYYGEIEYRASGTQRRVLALLVANVPNEGDAWNYTLESLSGFFERVLQQRRAACAAPPALIAENVGGIYLERIRQLGERTAQMHLALAADSVDGDFAPEQFTAHYQHSLYQSMHDGTRRMTRLLKSKMASLPEKYRAEAEALLMREDEIIQHQSVMLERKFIATRIRHHGDYHLGQVLNTGRDFIIIDFEGEPAVALSERRAKHSPLRDVAGMLRSFHYAAQTALALYDRACAQDFVFMEEWADAFVASISRNFLAAYLATAKGASFIPDDSKALALMIEVFLIEKATYEVCYELNNRPDWVFIPMRGLVRTLDGCCELSDETVAR